MTSITQSRLGLAATGLTITGVLRRLLATDGAIAPVFLRLTLAVVMFPHGAQKVLGWFGGYGFEGTLGFMTSLGIPAALATVAILAEFLAPIALVVGIGTRFAGLALVGLMVGAIATVHLPHGFFMNWTGAQAGEGFEFHLLVIGMALALAVAGGGRWSVDRKLAR
jgi:putative oxidoreductase